MELGDGGRCQEKSITWCGEGERPWEHVGPTHTNFLIIETQALFFFFCQSQGV